ncbi:unnamed protein product [marine sediment metagenome]|uniref:Uncharacterized protein n=1 Tax=marine sediment metagenome TaxID=412755 RepID=X1E7J4_9ZZZZ
MSDLRVEVPVTSLNYRETLQVPTIIRTHWLPKTLAARST